MSELEIKLFCVDFRDYIFHYVGVAARELRLKSSNIILSSANSVAPVSPFSFPLSLSLPRSLALGIKPES